MNVLSETEVEALNELVIERYKKEVNPNFPHEVRKQILAWVLKEVAEEQDLELVSTKHTHFLYKSKDGRYVTCTEIGFLSEILEFEDALTNGLREVFFAHLSSLTEEQKKAIHTLAAQKGVDPVDFVLEFFSQTLQEAVKQREKELEDAEND